MIDTLQPRLEPMVDATEVPAVVKKKRRRRKRADVVDPQPSDATTATTEQQNETTSEAASDKRKRKKDSPKQPIDCKHANSTCTHVNNFNQHFWGLKSRCCSFSAEPPTIEPTTMTPPSESKFKTSKRFGCISCMCTRIV